MKIVIMFFALFLFACGTQKNSKLESNQSRGIVELSEHCTIIHSEIEGKPITMYPVNIEDKFKKEGLKIQFDFALSRAAQPTNCIVDRVVSVSNVSISK